MRKKRIYQFCGPDYALENIENKRIKVTRFSGCNDPFELAPFSLKDQALRKRHKRWFDHFDSERGILCFSRSWKNPVMWGQYAKRHTGICLGFNVDPTDYFDVRYTNRRIYPGISLRNFTEYFHEDNMEELFGTKYLHWNYEEEVRKIVTIRDCLKIKDNRFVQFSDALKLKQVIIGSESDMTVEDIEDVLDDSSVEIFQARRAFKSFDVVRQKDKSLWNRRNVPRKP